MCGIAGIVALKNSTASFQVVKKMTDVLSHRGPDGEGHWINEDATVGLGHRRLSIIDLTNSAAQPMHYMDRYIMVFNGEIYNYLELKEILEKEGYRFRSNSDSEVLMALYDQKGKDCLSLVDGMFAFAIWDKKQQSLFCARDRFGEKPFFYTIWNGCLYFASEIKAFWAIGVPKQADRETLFYFMQMGRVHHPYDRNRTFFKNINRLKPAHYLTCSIVNNKLSEEKCYWSLPKKSYKADQSFNENNVKEQFLSLFKTSVHHRLRSDVPVGSSLSGGLDSSAVVCMINELNSNANFCQNTFSARFPGFIKDEGKYIDIVLNNVKATSHFTYPSHSDFIKQFDKMYYHQDEPFGSASIYAQWEVMRLAKEKGVTVLLDGQGADEMLAGYDFYKDTINKKFKQSTNKFRVKEHLKQLIPFAYNYYRRHKLEQYLNQVYLKKGYHADYIEEILKYSYPQERHESLHDHLVHDLIMGNLEDLLRYADRNSMAHSREVRLPFLNHKLVEFIMSLPDDYKIRGGWSKWIQRVSFEKLLPSEITWRKDKIGYEPPQKDWMSDPMMRELIYEGKQLLYREHILTKDAASKEPQATESFQIGDNSWYFFMTSKLFT